MQTDDDTRLRYNVSWRSDGAAAIANSKITEQPQLVVPLERNLASSSSPCSSLVVSIRPFNELGAGLLATNTIINLPDGAPPIRVASQVRARALNATTLNVDWKWLNEDACENVRGIVLSCAPTGDGDETTIAAIAAATTKNVTLAPHLSEFLLGDLEPSTRYVCT